MKNRIRWAWVHSTRLDPVETEIWVCVGLERLLPTTQIQGRLMGPRCPYASTVEVAYPLREAGRWYPEAKGSPYLTLRVIIPEASWWDTESPFLYQGPVELWQDGECCDVVQLSHGSRVVTLGPTGLRLNARPLTLRGVAEPPVSEGEARRLHREGCNALLVPVVSANGSVWDTADRFGFVVLGQVTEKAGLHRAYQLMERPSPLGWVLNWDLLQNPSVMPALPRGPLSLRQLLGVDLSEPPNAPLPDGISFVLCDEHLLPALAAIKLAKVVRTRGKPVDTSVAGAGILGSIAV